MTNLTKIKDFQNLCTDKGEVNHKEIIKLKTEITLNFLELGKRLCLCQQKEYYRIFDCETFEEYIAMPELGFGRSWAYEMMKLYQTYIKRLKIDPVELTAIGPTKLLVVEPIVTKDNWEALKHKAETLSVSDLKIERLEARQKTIKKEIEEIILSLTSKQVVELFLACGGDLEDAFYQKILQHKEFRLIRTTSGNVWKAIGY